MSRQHATASTPMFGWVQPLVALKEHVRCYLVRVAQYQVVPPSLEMCVSDALDTINAIARHFPEEIRNDIELQQTEADVTSLAKRYLHHWHQDEYLSTQIYRTEAPYSVSRHYWRTRLSLMVRESMNSASPFPNYLKSYFITEHGVTLEFYSNRKAPHASPQISCEVAWDKFENMKAWFSFADAFYPDVLCDRWNSYKRLEACVSIVQLTDESHYETIQMGVRYILDEDTISTARRMLGEIVTMLPDYNTLKVISGVCDLNLMPGDLEVFSRRAAEAEKILKGGIGVSDDENDDFTELSDTSHDSPGNREAVEVLHDLQKGT